MPDICSAGACGRAHLVLPRHDHRESKIPEKCNGILFNDEPEDGRSDHRDIIQYVITSRVFVREEMGQF